MLGQTPLTGADSCTSRPEPGVKIDRGREGFVVRARVPLRDGLVRQAICR
jgi:hypothetical protein